MSFFFGTTSVKGAVIVKIVTERPKWRETMAGSRSADYFLPFRPFGHGFHRIGPSRNLLPTFLPKRFHILSSCIDLGK